MEEYLNKSNVTEYLAHISEDQTRLQTVYEHSCNVAECAGQFAEKFGCYDWGYCEGMMHDIGKMTTAFQERLRGGRLVDHATAGAKELNAKGGYYPLLAYCVVGHHAGLPDYGGPAYAKNRATLRSRMKKDLEDYQDYKKEITIPQLSEPKIKPLGKGGFSVSFFIRMLYSCLVDADFLDTEKFMSDGKAERNPGESMEILWKKFQHYTAGWLSNEEHDTINGRRSEILRTCLEKSKAPQGIFTMTVPTGGGKTLASLGFALRHALEHHLDRIIYVVPYTSIIEQNSEVFRSVLGPENVLENHCNVDYDGTEELRLWQLASENFDMRVVVTTNVQFFESLFARKPARCRKIHNYANSVIIFDEAQMIPTEFLKPCVQAMAELVTNYRSSIVLCTATQPAFENFFPDPMCHEELCPRVEEQFAFFKRNRMEDLTTISEADLIERLQGEQQALCILNNRKRVQKIYQSLSGDGVYALSTLMYPKERSRKLEEIRERLKEGKRCIVVATSLVEAGVDLDFQNVYREIAGVDSLIQAAGRGNREGKRAPEDCHVYVFRLAEKMDVAYELKQPMKIAEQIQREYQDLSSLEAIHEYMVRLYLHKGESLDKKKIIETLEEGILGNQYPFATIAEDFRLIQDATKSVMIIKEEEAEELECRLRRGERSRQLMRKVGQYCVNLYQDTYQKLIDAGILEPLDEELSILAVKNRYSNDRGLLTEAETGDALLL